jgi:hypothetical protein
MSGGMHIRRMGAAKEGQQSWSADARRAGWRKFINALTMCYGDRASLG